ncbi:MAG: TetR/AcrR family transcriptional regulator [Myxococcota bacterium]
MNEREERIVDTAVELAKDGGFKAVRMREVAALSGCALATLYRHFPRKDDLLLAALNREAQFLDRRMRSKPPAGSTPLERVTAHFDAATKTLFRRPALAREILRAATSDDAELWGKIRAFHQVAGDLVVAALRGDPDASLSNATEEELKVCQVLQQVWFAALVGGVSGRDRPHEVSRRLHTAAELVLRGAKLDR